MKKSTKGRKKRSATSVSNSFSVLTMLLIVALTAVFCFVACSDKDKDKDKDISESGDSSEAMKQSTVEDESEATMDSSYESKVEVNSSDDESSDENMNSTMDNSSESLTSEEPSSSTDVTVDTSGGGEVYSHIEWFKAENGRRYDAYGEKNPQYTKEQVVTYVNIGLDGAYYTNTYPASKSDGIFILVNKYSYVDRNFTPDNLVELDSSCKVSGKSVMLVKEAADAFKRLSDDAAALEYCILGMSGYRTYSYQESLYNRYLQNDTKENVDTYSARPGYSEHHTGLALDVQTDTVSFSNFGQTKEYEWLLDNAHRYGFVIHYTEENKWITGYMPEEWHIRYVGIPAATYIYDNNLSVDEYLIMYGSQGPQAMG